MSRFSFAHRAIIGFTIAVGLNLHGQTLLAQPFNLPTANRAIYDADGGGEKFFVPTVGKTWTSGCFGCVRNSASNKKAAEFDMPSCQAGFSFTI